MQKRGKALAKCAFAGAAAWLLLALPNPVRAADYYVSLTGNNAGAGTSDQPWRTIQKAASTVLAGDTVFIRGGIYAERVTLSARSGTAASPITLRNFPGESVIVDQSAVTPPGGASALLKIQNCSHLTIQGIEFRNYKTTSKAATVIGIHITGSGTGIRLLDNCVHGIWQSFDGLNDFGANGHGILVEGTAATPIHDLTLDGNEVYDLRLGASEAVVLNGNVDGFELVHNTVHDCNNIGIDFIGGEGTSSNPALDQARNGRCASNLVFNIDTRFNPAYGGSFTPGGSDDTRSAAGIYVDGASGIVIERNEIHHCNYGIEVASENAGANANAIIVRNNLLRANHVGGLTLGAAGAGEGATTNCSFTHNTLYQNDTAAYGGGQIQIQHHVSGSIIRHNIMVCNGTTRQFVLKTASTGSFDPDAIDWNLYTGATATDVEFIWNKSSKSTFTNWKTASLQDTHSFFAASAGFVNAATGDFHLQSTSSAVDAGDPAFAASPDELDFEGLKRVAGGRADLGLAEFGSVPPGVPGAVTEAADGVTYDAAVLHGLANPNGTASSAWFEFGTTTAYGLTTAAQDVGAGVADVPVSAPVSGLLPNRSYHVRLVAQNAIGIQRGEDHLFITQPLPPPLILQQPLPVIAGLGEAALFEVQTGGGFPQTFRWRKGTVSLTGATSAQYSIPSATFSRAGSYNVMVRNAAGSLTSSSAALGVIAASPSSIIVNEDKTLTLQQLAAGPGLSFAWFKDDSPLVDDGRITGAGTSRLIVRRAAAADGGTYVCHVTLGAISRPGGDFNVQVRLRPVLDAFAPKPWIVSGDVSDAITAQNQPTRFTVSGLPSGMTFDRATGALGGKPRYPGTYTLRITASNAAGTSARQTVIVTVAPMPAAATGSFRGLVDRQTKLNASLGGSLSLATTRTGAVSGSILLAGKTYRFSGRLDVPVSGAPTATLSVSRGRTLPALQLALAIDAADGDLSGTITDGIDSASLTGIRNPWHSTQAPALPFAGSYTTGLLVGPAQASNPVYPQGYGYASIRISQSGSVTWSGRLADGTLFSRSTLLGPDGSFPLHGTLYAGFGSIQGWPQITVQPPSNATTNTLSGAFDWLKLPSTSKTARLYRDGFPLHTVVIEGGSYLLPAKGSLILGLPPVPDNAVIVLSEGGLTSSTTQEWTIKSRQTAVIPAGLDNPTRMRLTLNAATGALSGSFRLVDPYPGNPARSIARTVRFSGRLLTQQGIGVGYFILSGLPDPLASPPVTSSQSPMLSGRLRLEPTVLPP